MAEGVSIRGSSERVFLYATFIAERSTLPHAAAFSTETESTMKLRAMESDDNFMRLTTASARTVTLRHSCPSVSFEFRSSIHPLLHLLHFYTAKKLSDFRHRTSNLIFVCFVYFLYLVVQFTHSTRSTRSTRLKSLTRNNSKLTLRPMAGFLQAKPTSLKDHSSPTRYSRLPLPSIG